MCILIKHPSALDRKHPSSSPSETIHLQPNTLQNNSISSTTLSPNPFPFNLITLWSPNQCCHAYQPLIISTLPYLIRLLRPILFFSLRKALVGGAFRTGSKPINRLIACSVSRYPFHFLLNTPSPKNFHFHKQKYAILLYVPSIISATMQPFHVYLVNFSWTCTILYMHFRTLEAYHTELYSVHKEHLCTFNKTSSLSRILLNHHHAQIICMGSQSYRTSSSCRSCIPSSTLFKVIDGMTLTIHPSNPLYSFTKPFLFSLYSIYSSLRKYNSVALYKWPNCSYSFMGRHFCDRFLGNKHLKFIFYK